MLVLAARAVAQCVFHRFCLNFWKDLKGSTRAERDRLVVVRNWLHRLQQIELLPEFDHEVNALKKHLAEEFAGSPVLQTATLAVLVAQLNDKEFWAWAYMQRACCMFVRTTSAAEGRHKNVKWGSLSKLSFVYDVFVRVVTVV